MQNKFFNAIEINDKVKEVFQKGVYVKKLEEDKSSITTCLLKIDAFGFFLSYQEKDKDAFCIDICDISYVKDGATPKALSKVFEQYTEEEKNNVDLLSRFTYICFGTNIVEVSFITFDFMTKELKQIFFSCISTNLTNHKHAFRNPSVNQMLYKQYVLSKSMLNASGKISMKNIFKCLNAVRFEQTTIEGIQTALSLPVGEIDPEMFSFEQFYKLCCLVCPRPDIDELFISLFGTRLTAEKLMKFLNEDQRDPRLNEQMHPHCTISNAVDLIMDYESNEACRTKELLTIQGFIQLLLSKESAVLNPECLLLRHDMNQPINHYFINSSHNTYLLGRQVYGKSSVEIYRQVLISGCRCIELDCWDGPGVPIITHGKAMCTNVLFSDVVQAIADTAFLTSPYPVVLSFENHCSLPQQKILAEMCIKIFGPLLLDKPLESNLLEPGIELPSPEQLKYKILIKNKKLASNDEMQFSNGKLSSANISYDIPVETNTSSYSSCDVPDLESESEMEHDNCFNEDDLGRMVTEDNFETKLDEKIDQFAKQVYSESSSNNQPVMRRRSTQEFNLKKYKLTKIAENCVVDDSEDEIILTKFGSNPCIASSLNEEVNSNTTTSALECEDSSSHFPSKQRSHSAAPFNYQSETEAVETKRRAISDISEIESSKKVSNMSTVMSNLPDNSITTNTVSGKVDPLLSSLINYVQPQTFKGFEYAEEQKKHYVMSSFSELEGLKQCTENLTDFVLYNKRQFSRIYPKATRVESTNYVPQVFWNAGCQFVALNLQTPDLSVQLNQQKFECNFNCGYLLKPVKYRETDSNFDPLTENPIDGIIPLTVEIEVISGQYLSEKKCMTYVQIDMFGLSADTTRKKRTNLSESNLMNTVYPKTVFKFDKIVFPEMVLVRFTVYDESDKLLGQRVLPLEGIKSGYRHIAMRSETGHFLPLTTLFVKFTFKIYIHEKYEDAVEELFNPNKYKLLAEHRASRIAKKLEDMLLSDEDIIVQNPKLIQICGDQVNSTSTETKRKSSVSSMGSGLNHPSLITSNTIDNSSIKMKSFGSTFDESNNGNRMLELCEDEFLKERKIDDFKLDKMFLRIAKKNGKEVDILKQNHRKERKLTESFYDEEISKLQMFYDKTLESELKSFEKSLQKINTKEVQVQASYQKIVEDVSMKFDKSSRKIIDSQMMELKEKYLEKTKIWKTEKVGKISVIVEEQKKALKIMVDEHIEKEARIKYSHSIQQIDLIGKLLKMAQDNDVKKLAEINEKELSDLTKAQARDSIQSIKDLEKEFENSKIDRINKEKIKRERDKLRIEEFGMQRRKLVLNQQKRQEKLIEKHKNENKQFEDQRKEIIQLGYEPIIRHIKQAQTLISLHQQKL